MNKNNERQLKEIAKKGFALKMEIQKCETEMAEGSQMIIQGRKKISKAKSVKTKAHKTMMELF